MSVVLSSLGEAAPSGENLEYEQVFTELVLAAQFGEERQAGKEILPEQEPDPATIAIKAEAVLAKSHDLRAAALLAYAELRRDGWTGFAGATSYIRGCLENFWNTCHPQLDAEDDDDPTMRVNAVLGLADPRTVLRAVRTTPLTDSPNFGRFSLRDIAIAEGELEPPPEMNVPERVTIAAAFQDTPLATLEVIHAGVRGAYQDILAINRIFDEKLPGRGPALDPLIRNLKRAADRLGAVVGEPANVGEETVSEDAIATAVDPAPAPRGMMGEISTRQDVEAAIDKILAYYGKHEPSSPVPILLSRAKRLVGADFMTIVKDLAPGGADNVKLLGGLE